MFLLTFNCREAVVFDFVELVAAAPRIIENVAGKAISRGQW